MNTPEKPAPEWPNIGKFRFWLARPNWVRPSSFTYHWGFLAFDRGQFVEGTPNSILNDRRWVGCDDVAKIAKLAWGAYERGEVTLVQRKLGRNRYQYIAMRR